MPLDTATVTNPRAATEAALCPAQTRLMQAQECDRIGYLRDSFVEDAADLLRAAGHGELADRLGDDPWGDETVAVLAEVTKARMR